MYEPKIIGFLCTWCSYTGADLAGTVRLKSPWNMRAVRVPCSGRVSPELVMRAFDEGADGVLVLGCHIGECHYDTGNHRAAKRIPILKSMMAFTGLEPERLKLDWVSASESDRYAKLVTEFTESIRVLGPVKWRLNQGEWPIETVEEIQINEKIKEISSDWVDQKRINQVQSTLRDTARELLESNRVNCVIGYETGPRNRTRPTFISDPSDVDRLVWNQTCTHNLTTYLPEKLRSTTRDDKQYSVAVVAKPCDSKSINIQIAENRFNRENVHVIGVICDGIYTGAGYGKASGEYQHRCLRCVDRKPVLYDTLLGDPATIQVEGIPLDDDLEKLETLSSSEKMNFWVSQFDRCIRCYACRQVCPSCNCPECLYERNDSLWIRLNIELNEKRTFHLGRAFHLVGRCIGCDECERVCPMDIPIGLINRKLVVEVESTMGYQAGLAPIPSPITTILEAQESKSWK
jgi:coenzyme F420-reducing hydrogenase delta subunit/ferredoxin